MNGAVKSGRVPAKVANDPARQAAARAYCLQALTWRTMLHTMLSNAKSMSEFGRRVFASAAQQKPLDVRTRIVDVPGKLPLCHQLFAVFTDHPFP